MNLKHIMASAFLMAGFFFAGNWNADTANAKVNFSVKGPFGTIHGSFTGLKTTIKFDEKDLGASSIEASIDAKTVNSGIGMRNKHLRSEEEWLNTDKFPVITWRSDKIEKTGAGYKATGKLTLKGIAKPVAIAFTFTGKDNSGIFKGQFTIKREDYKVGKAGGSVGSDITINLEVPVKK